MKKKIFQNFKKIVFFTMLIVLILLVSYFISRFNGITSETILNLKIIQSSQKISDTQGNFLETLDNDDRFGSSITSIGDLDDDNITDIVVGAYLDDDGGTGRGAVYVLFMYQNGTVKSSQKISDTQGNFLETLDDFDSFGRSVTSIGDLDGDSITDIVVGAYADDDGGTSNGAVYVLFMYQNGTVKSSQKISDTQGNFNEILSGDEFGISVTSIGDLDNDGITDIVVGAFFDNDGGASNGAVYVLFMNTNGTVKSSQKISDTEGNFNEILNDTDLFGISVTSIGDLDNDGITDIVVGAFFDNDGGSSRGAVYVLFMYQNGTVKSSQKISDTEGNFNEILNDFDRFGISVTSIGDLDNDSITDIVVGAYFDGDGGANRGAVYVLFLNEVIPPNITINSPTNNSYSSNPVIFNRTIVDQSGILNVSLILNGIYNETNSSGINNTDYIFTKTLSEGMHNWTYEACDTINNCINLTVITFTVDATNPTATLTCSPSTLTLGQVVTCTCSGTDAGVGLNNSATPSPEIITTTGAGTFTVSGCSVKDLAGNSASATGTYTVRSGGNLIEDSTTQITQQINSFTEITVDSGAAITDFDADIGISEIKIEVNEYSSNVKITVKKYDSSPAAVSKEISGSVYRYLEIEAINLEDNLEKGIITIQVERSWVSNNSLEKDQIAMFKFDNSSEIWNELSTVFTDEDNEFYFYDIELDSFSFFVISGKVVGEEVDGEITEEVEEKRDLNLLWWIFGIILILGIITYFIWRRKTKFQLKEKAI